MNFYICYTLTDEDWTQAFINFWMQQYFWIKIETNWITNTFFLNFCSLIQKLEIDLGAQNKKIANISAFRA